MVCLLAPAAGPGGRSCTGGIYAAACTPVPAGSAFIPASGYTKFLHFTLAYLQLYEKVFGDFHRKFIFYLLKTSIYLPYASIIYTPSLYFFKF